MSIAEYINHSLWSRKKIYKAYNGMVERISVFHSYCLHFFSSSNVRGLGSRFGLLSPHSVGVDLDYSPLTVLE